MTIDVSCGGCGKQFSVGEQYAGKRAKCKFCQTIFVVPAIPAPDGALDIDLIPFRDVEEPVRTAVPLPPYKPPREPRSAPAPSRVTMPAPSRGTTPAPMAMPTPAPAIAPPSADRGVRMPLAYMPRQPASSVASGNSFLEWRLPRLCIAAGFVGPLAYQLVEPFLTDNPGVGLRFCLIALPIQCVCWFAIVLPLTILGIRIAGKIMKFEPSPPVFTKAWGFGSSFFAVQMIMLLIVKLLSLGSTPGSAMMALLLMVFGFVLSIVGSFFLTWGMFRVRFGEAVVTWLFSGVFYLIGAGGCIGLGWWALKTLERSGNAPALVRFILWQY